MDAAPWPQEIKLGKSMEEISSNQCTRSMLERKAKPQEQLNCPRCNSTNTKFCYYNNYSLTQPRYFCKTCRRYWTEGGSLRNVPVGGGSRKNKRSSSSSSSANSSSSSANSSHHHKMIPDLNPPNLSHFSNSHQNPNKSLVHEGQDLNLSFPVIHQDSQALELLRTGITSRGLNSFMPGPMPDSNTLYSSGYPMQEFKPTLSFSVEGLGSRSYGVEENGGRILFPLGDHQVNKHLSINTSSEIDHDHQNKGQGPNNGTAGFWNGMFGGNAGGSW